MNPTVFTLKGKIKRTSGYSEAYREAVLSGYEGTKDEWLADIQERITDGETVGSAEFNALLTDKQRKRFMKG